MYCPGIMKDSQALMLFLFIGIGISCARITPTEIPVVLFKDQPENQSIANVLKRAQQISQIQWTPLYNIPSNQGFYKAGSQIKGIPYSSVKELDKFVGIDVSFTTFMTAVHNPRSVLYTEDVSKSPYNGINCSSYYGTVCSSTIAYALGLKAAYPTSMIDTMPLFKKGNNQNPESIKLGDLLLSKGHVVMVYEIIREDNITNISSVAILESAGISTTIRRYSFEEFKERWEQSQWVIYKYNFEHPVEYVPSPFVSIDGETTSPFICNDMICTNRGDYVVYREGEPITINIQDSSFVQLSIHRNKNEFLNIAVDSVDKVLYDLQSGSYEVFALDGKGLVSNPVHFVVVDTNVSIKKDKESIEVLFKSHHAKPIYVAICNKKGENFYIKEFNDSEATDGRVFLKYPQKSGLLYCKVYFATDYGTVTNLPLLI